MAVATIDDKVVGFIQILTMGNSFYLDLVAVSGSHQKSGIALQMIEFVFENSVTRTTVLLALKHIQSPIHPFLSKNRIQSFQIKLHYFITMVNLMENS